MVDFLALLTFGLLVTSIILTFKKHTNRSVFWIATLVAIVGFGWIAPDTNEEKSLNKNNTEKSVIKENKNVNTATQSPINILKKNIEESIDRKIKIEKSLDESCIMIRFPMNDSQWSVNDIVRRGQKDILLILSEYKSMPLNNNSAVCITGTLASIDSYGRENKDSAAMMVSVEYATLQKMNFKNLQFNPDLLDNYDLYGYTLMSWVK